MKDELSNDWLGIPNCPDCTIIRPGYFDRKEAELDVLFVLNNWVLDKDQLEGLSNDTTFESLQLVGYTFRLFEKEFYHRVDEILDVTEAVDIDFSKQVSLTPATVGGLIDKVFELNKQPIVSACAIHSVWP